MATLDFVLFFLFVFEMIFECRSILNSLDKFCKSWILRSINLGINIIIQLMVEQKISV